MTNEELVTLIRQDRRELIPELWAQVENFIKYMANRLIFKLPASWGVEFEDLVQSGYLGMMKAIEYYDPSHGTAFTTVLSMTLKTAFAEAAGCRTDRQRLDPLLSPSTRSLEAPLRNDGESDTLLRETVPDTRDAFINAEERICLEQLHKTLEEILINLDDDQSDVLQQRFYGNKTLKRVAENRGCSTERARQIEGEALRRVRNPKYRRILEPFNLEIATPYYMKVGARQFQTTFTSATEAIVFWRDDKREVQLR